MTKDDGIPLTNLSIHVLYGVVNHLKASTASNPPGDLMTGATTRRTTLSRTWELGLASPAVFGRRP